MTVNKVWRLLSAMMPFAVIGGLLYAGIFIKPASVGSSVAPPVLAPRDAFYGVAVPADGVIWAVGRGGKIVRSDDGGRKWLRQPAATDANLQSIAAWDAARAVVVGNDGTVLLSADGGRSWQAVAGLPGEAAGRKLIRVRRSADGRVYAVGEFGLVLSAPGFGGAWESLGKPEDVGWNDLAARENTLILTGEFGRIRRSGDGGRNWQDVASPVKSSLLGVAFSADGRLAVAVGLDGVVLLSTDDGQSWRAVSSGTREHLFSVTAHNAGWAAVGDKGLLLRAPADAQTWEVRRLSENSYAWHADIEAHADRLYLAGATLSAVGQDNKLEQFK
jgi:photosystem II stability/assembly factor-like uncharacterized protein